MQSFIVLALLVSELAGGQNDLPFYFDPLVLNVTKNTLSFKGYKHNLLWASAKTYMHGIERLFSTHVRKMYKMEDSLKHFLPTGYTKAESDSVDV